MRRVPVIMLTLVMCAAMVFAAEEEAEAHGRIGTGRYPCYTYNSGGGREFTGYVLRIRSGQQYTLIYRSSWAKRGSFHHPSTGSGLRWTSGYLKRNARGSHLFDRRLGMNVIEILWNTPRGGHSYYHCFK
jgi:hypothetical protein